MKRHYNIYAPSWTKSYKFFRLKKTLFSNTKIYFFGAIRNLKVIVIVSLN